MLRMILSGPDRCLLLAAGGQVDGCGDALRLGTERT
jgi:hypothetical protein